ncbi:MAG: hypothetical protein HY547_02175 [Elusimicrobia bacterium]|nr:hypothetical protein [Elusimicrobiota bacterium]
MKPVMMFLTVILGAWVIFAGEPRGLTPALERKLFAKAKELLVEIKAAEAETGMFNRVPFRVGSTNNGQMAAYVHGVRAIIFNRTLLDQLYWDIMGRGAPVDDPVNVMAVHLLAVMAHELRHALNEEFLGHAPATQEEEVSAWVTNVSVFHEARQKFEAQYSISTALLGQDLVWWTTWREEGLPGLRSRAAGAYNFVSIFDDDDIELAQDSELSDLWERREKSREVILKYCRQGTEAFDGCLERYGLSKDYKPWVRNRTEGLVQNRRQFRAAREYFEEMEVFWADRGRVQAARNYYRLEECRAWDLWQAAFPQEPKVWEQPQQCSQ